MFLCKDCLKLLVECVCFMCRECDQGIVVLECCNASCVLFACFEEAVEFFGVYIDVVCEKFGCVFSFGMFDFFL